MPKKADEKLILGTRGSPLALAQSRRVAEDLMAAAREEGIEIEVELKVVKTEGDKDQNTPLSGFAQMGIFVKELQRSLQKGEIDFAVHSLKDVPPENPDDLLLAAFPEREDARDAFISKGPAFRALPAGSKIGSGSPRRVLQLRALRPDLEYLPLRGNLDTRIAKVTEGRLDGIVLATAGLARLDWKKRISHTFSLHEMIPAVGQGALGLECRARDEDLIDLLGLLNDEETEDLVSLERDFMGLLGGSCKSPMAAHAYAVGEEVRFLALVGHAEKPVFARAEQGFAWEDEEEALSDLLLRLRLECEGKGIPFPDLDGLGRTGHG